MEHALEVNNLSVFYGTTHALQNITLDINKGEFLGIMGPNGGGKSTFLKAILGLVPVKEGSIFFPEKRRIGYVPQFASMDRTFPISVLEVVLTGGLNNGLRPFYRYTSEEKNRALKKLEMLDIQKLENRQIRDLSGGEFQRLMIARALMTEPGLLLLDEPTANVDAASREHIYNILEELNKEMTIVLVTHDLMAISSKIKSLACLNQTMVYHGKPEITDTMVNKLYGYPVELVSHGVPHRVLQFHKEV